jgi:branched-chain amino acid transport system permease protein
MDYIIHAAIFIGIYAILAVSLDLLTGHTGILSIAHAGFYGIGAYSSAILTTKLQVSFLIAVIIAVAIAMLISLIVSVPSLRLHEDYFVIAQFGFQIILFSIFNNWNDLTGGALGLTGIPSPSVFGFTIKSNIGFVFLTALMTLFAYILVLLLTTSPLGRVLWAIREDEVFAKAMGKNTLYFKVTAFGISAGLAAMAGCIYAHYIHFIDPTSFTVMESVLIISMLIIGGVASRWGPLIGAATLVSLPELLRFAGFPGPIAAELRQVFYGILLVLVIMFRPRRMIGKSIFGK